MIELDPDDIRTGLSTETMERRALAMIGKVTNTGYRTIWHGLGNKETYEHNLPKVCERSTQPLPYGCWSDASRSPYARWGAERWCDACIAYAALNGTLPKPQQQIDGSTQRVVLVP